MESLWSTWSLLDMRRKAIVIGATLSVFAAVLFLTAGAGTRDMALLYSGLEADAAGDVVTALEQNGAAYEVRGNAIYVAASARDALRMTLAAEGLPPTGSQGYELLDQLSGFGTTSQMFDAAYWRAKEGELARTILASPAIRSARVHISTPSTRPFQRDQIPTAAVTVTTAGGTLSPRQAKALRYLVAAAVSGLAPENVAVIDGEGGLIAAADEAGGATGGAERSIALRQQVERLLEARVGYGNAVVELSVETVMESESITQRTIDPESRVAISTEVEERSNSTQDNRTDVTVASNLPDGDAAGGGGSTAGQSNETRALTNFEISETMRELTRAPGAIKRLSVAVLVNDVTTEAADGTTTTAPRSAEELASLRELVASAVGFDEARGDVITLKSMSFEPVAPLGTEALATAGLGLDAMSLIRLAVLALVALVLGLFVIRPILSSSRPQGLAALPPPDGDVLDGTLDGDAGFPMMAFPPMGSPMGGDGMAGGMGAMGGMGGMGGDWDDGAAMGGQDAVSRLRRMIEERQAETVEILQSWIEEPEPRSRG